MFNNMPFEQIPATQTDVLFNRAPAFAGMTDA